MIQIKGPLLRWACCAVFLVALGCLAIALEGCGQRVTTVTPMSEEEQLVRQFAELKNAGNPRAHDLLGAAAEVPPESVSPEEAQRLDAEIFLRRDYRVKEVRPVDRTAAGSTAFVLVIDGNLMSEPMTVRQEIPKKLVSWPVPQPTSNTVLL